MQITKVRVESFGWEVEPWRVGSGDALRGEAAAGGGDGGDGRGGVGPRLSESAGASRAVADRCGGAAGDWAQPAGHRGDLGGSVEAESGDSHISDRGDRYLPVGHQRQSRGAADSPTAGHLQGVGAGLFQHGVVGDAAGVRGRGAAFPGGRLERAQDSPALRSEGGHRNLPRSARGGRRRVDPDAGLDVGVLLRGRGAGGGGRSRSWTTTGTRIRWWRRTSTAT